MSSKIKGIDRLIQEIETLKQVNRKSAEHVKWIFATTNLLKEIFGDDSSYYNTFTTLTWSHQGDMFIRGLDGLHDPMGSIERLHQEAYIKQLEIAKGLLLAARESIEKGDLKENFGKQNKAKSSFSLIWKIISGVVIVIGLLSSLITIAIGWREFFLMVKRILHLN